MLFSRRRPSKSKRSARYSRLICESLESRRLLAADVWSGAGPDALFSDAANWVGGVVPTSGQAVTFPANATSMAVTVDTNVTVGAVEFDAAYTLSSPLAGATTITLDGNLTATGGSTVVNNNITLGQTTIALINPTAAIDLEGVIDDGGSGFGITQEGNGALTLGGAGDTYTGATEADGGAVVDNASLTSAVTVFPGSSFTGSNSITSLAGDDGTYSASDAGAAATVTLASGLHLQANSGNTVSFLIGGPGASSQFAVSAGTISLGNATFSATALTYAPVAGDVITLIANNTWTAVVGTFKNLPEGSDVIIGSEKYQISYAGGISGVDVTLTALTTASTTTLTDSRSPIIEGETEVLTAKVTGVDGVTPTGAVTFYDNGSPLVVNGTTDFTLVGGIARLGVSNLPAGGNTIVASYDGGGIHTASNSAAVDISVRRGTTPIVINLTTIGTTLATTTTVTTHGISAGATISASDATSDVLTYTWSTLHVPSGAKDPIFNTNGDSAAQEVIMHFKKDGGYVVQCKVSDPSGNFAYTDVDVTVSQKASVFRIEPKKARIPQGESQQYTAVVLDQFGRPMRTAQTLTYAIQTGRDSGTIDATGLFSATSIDGTVIIEIEDGTLIGTVGAYVVS
jgi:hypothetical protein